MEMETEMIDETEMADELEMVMEMVVEMEMNPRHRKETLIPLLPLTLFWDLPPLSPQETEVEAALVMAVAAVVV